MGLSCRDTRGLLTGPTWPLPCYLTVAGPQVKGAVGLQGADLARRGGVENKVFNKHIPTSPCWALSPMCDTSQHLRKINPRAPARWVSRVCPAGPPAPPALSPVIGGVLSHCRYR